MKKYLLEIVVFTTGLGIMVFEIVGSRVLAPYVGTTTGVWSVLIGTILMALSVGYWWGGRIADRKADYKNLSRIIFAAGIFVGLTALFKQPVINFFDAYFTRFESESFILSLILFCPGSFFMAAVSPYAVRLRLANPKDSGEVVGKLYSVSTVGSIAGAFLAGLVLIPLIGSTEILYALSILLILISILAFTERNLKAKTAAAIIVGVTAFFGSKIDYHFLPLDFIETEYQDIALVSGIDKVSDLDNGNPTGRPILQVFTGPDTVQSAMFTDKDDDLVLPYTEVLSVLSNYFKPKIGSVLVVGGGVYSLPKYYLKKDPDTKVDVVEIDKEMTSIAKQYFNLPDDPRLISYAQDGRTYLNRNEKKYDVIVMDSFKTYVVPFQLTTLETAKAVYNSLSDDGVILINMIQSIEGDSGKFFREEYKTYKQVFPQLYVFRVQQPDPSVIQNILLVASKSPQRDPLTSTDERTASYLEHVWTGSAADDVKVLTDNYAPDVDYTLQASQAKKAQD